MRSVEGRERHEGRETLKDEGQRRPYRVLDVWRNGDPVAGIFALQDRAAENIPDEIFSERFSIFGFGVEKRTGPMFDEQGSDLNESEKIKSHLLYLRLKLKK